jgi:hypothetical protein
MRRALEWLRRLFVKWFQCLYELLCVGPLILIAGVLLVPRPYIILWFGYLAGAGLAGLLLGQFLKKSRTWLRLLLSLAAAGIPAYFLFGTATWAIITTFMGIILVYRASLLAHTSWEAHFPLHLSWFSLGIYLITSFVFDRAEALKPYHLAVSLAGLVLLAAMVFALNHRAMKKAAHAAGERVSLPRRMLSQNRWIAGIVIGIVFLIGLFRQLKEIVGTAAGTVVQWIVQFFDRLFEGLRTVPLARGGLSLFPRAEGESNPFLQALMNVLLYILAGAVALLVVGGAIYLIWRAVRVLYRAFSLLLGRRSEGMREGYIDKRESLWDMKRMAQNTLMRTREWFQERFTRPDRWADMVDNQERMRFLYRRYVRRAMEKGFVPSHAATAAETVRDSQRHTGDTEAAGLLIEGYQRARYGEYMPTDTQIAAIKDILDGR